MLAILLLAFGVVSRLIVHLPNFTPVIALALFGGVYLKKQQAVILPVLMMIIADLFIGVDGTFLFTWGSMALIAVMGLWVRENKSFTTVAGSSLLASVLFFLVSNFGVWLVQNMYPHTLAGLIECYAMAIPFFGPTLASTVVYTAVLFGGYEWAAARLRKTRLAYIVL
jgi:hypothetical protein